MSVAWILLGRVDKFIKQVKCTTTTDIEEIEKLLGGQVDLEMWKSSKCEEISEALGRACLSVWSWPGGGARGRTPVGERPCD